MLLIRDTACVAAGSFVRSCPEESREYLASLRPVFLQHLRDPIATIRYALSPTKIFVEKLYILYIQDVGVVGRSLLAKIL